MRPRKAVWVVGGIVLLGLLCLLPIAYRPVPYRFLNGATLDRVQVRDSADPARGSVTFAVYRLNGNLQRVRALAKKELTQAEGWSWIDRSDLAERLSDGSWIAFTRANESQVYVKIQRQATILDRLSDWMHKNQKI
jgi:hypothetical protein